MIPGGGIIAERGAESSLPTGYTGVLARLPAYCTSGVSLASSETPSTTAALARIRRY